MRRFTKREIRKSAQAALVAPSGLLWLGCNHGMAMLAAMDAHCLEGGGYIEGFYSEPTGFLDRDEWARELADLDCYGESIDDGHELGCKPEQLGWPDWDDERELLCMKGFNLLTYSEGLPK